MRSGRRGRPARPPQDLGPEQDLGRRGRREQHLGVDERSLKIGEPGAASAGRARQGVRLGTAAAHDDQVGQVAARCQRVDEALAHLAGTDDDDPPSAKRTAEMLGGERHRDVGERGDAPGDPRLGPGALSDLDGVAEQAVEHGTRGPLVLGTLVRRAHLAQDLALAEHR